MGVEVEVQVKVKAEAKEEEEDIVRCDGKDRRGCGGRALIFTYGTLKKGFSNHVLMQDLISAGEAAYVGACRTVDRYPLVCGPYRVPFLLNMPGMGERVWGELYSVSDKGLARMDELEGTSKGHYERLPIKAIVVVAPESDDNIDDDDDDDDDDDIDCKRRQKGGGEREGVDDDDIVQAYFGHRSYAQDLWRRNGEEGFAIYSEKETRGYIKRKDRPQNITFLEQIRIFNSSSPHPPLPISHIHRHHHPPPPPHR